jgi:hypothetical protein
MLQLHLDIDTEADGNGFVLEGGSLCHPLLHVRPYADSRNSSVGMALQGAAWQDGLLQANDGDLFPVASILLSWRETPTDALPADKTRKYAFPVYLNGDRDLALFTASLESRESSVMLTQRGVCMMAHS